MPAAVLLFCAAVASVFRNTVHLFQTASQDAQDQGENR